MDAYRDLGFINAEEHKVGLKFQEIYYSTVMCRSLNDEGLMDDDDIEVAKLDKTVKLALKGMSHNSRRAIVDVCGHGEPVHNAAKLNALITGLGHLALLWRAAAEEVCEHKA